jgi:hypothetical protein
MRMLLLGVVAVALVLTAIRTVHLALKGNYKDVVAKLNRVKGIHDIRIYEIDEGFGIIDAEGLSFRIFGKEESYIAIPSPTLDLFTSASSIGLACIGDIEVSVSHYVNGRLEGGGYVDIGRASPLREVLPFTLRNFDELIDRYDELEAYFKQWPKYPATLELAISPTETLKYYRTSRRERFAQ